jgi:hypothetical protein
VNTYDDGRLMMVKLAAALGKRLAGEPTSGGYRGGLLKSRKITRKVVSSTLGSKKHGTGSFPQVRFRQQKSNP